MSKRKGDPLKKVTLNLYHADVIKLEHDLGYGWTQWVRDLIHDKLRSGDHRSYEPFLIEDLTDV